jgi:hypothetical protein
VFYTQKGAKSKEMNEIAIFRSINEAVLYCRKRGYSITYPGLYYVITSHMEIFRRSVIGTYYPKIYVDEIDEYIALSENKPSEDELTIVQISKEFKLTKGEIYRLIKEGKIQAKRYGRGKGILHVRRQDFGQYRSHHKKPGRKKGTPNA